MKFIFPQNYDFKTKLLGFIDYSTALLDALWATLVLGGINLFKLTLNIKIFLFVILVFPIFIFSIVGFNGENIINVCIYLFKYMIKPKVLLYKK